MRIIYILGVYIVEVYTRTTDFESGEPVNKLTNYKINYTGDDPKQGILEEHTIF